MSLFVRRRFGCCTAAALSGAQRVGRVAGMRQRWPFISHGDFPSNVRQQARADLFANICAAYNASPSAVQRRPVGAPVMKNLKVPLIAFAFLASALSGCTCT